MKVDAKIWNTLILCTADKGDLRSYLCGINFDFKYNRLASTNGHRLFVQNNVGLQSDSDSIILSVDNKFKAPSDIDEIEINDDAFGSNLRIQVNYLKNDEVVMSRYANVIDGTFPDIDRVLPTEISLKPVDVVGINPEYLADVPKTLKVKAMKLQCYNGDKFGIEFPPIKDIQYVVMAMRV